MQKTLLGIYVVLDITCHSYPEPVKAIEITERLGMQGRYLEQIFQQLVTANIINSIRGPKGGYVLYRERRNITIADIVRAMQEKNTGIGFGDEYHDIIMPIWRKSEEQFLDVCEKTTLDELLQQWKRKKSTPLTSGKKFKDDDSFFSI